MNAFTCLFRRMPKLSNVFVRSYAREPFSLEWTKPKIPSCISTERSGDLGIDYKIDPKEPCLPYQKVLDNENEDVKKIFSVEYNFCKEIKKLQIQKARALVQDHETDTKSFQSVIAKLTSEIHYLQDRMKVDPKGKLCKIALKEKIEKRNKFLRRLRSWDYKRFEWILEKLNLVYRPQPLQYTEVTRKGSLRKLAKMECEKIRQGKLDAYKAELKSQQKGFYEKKAKQLAFIREEEIFCGVEPTVSEEEIETAKKIAEKL